MAAASKKPVTLATSAAAPIGKSDSGKSDVVKAFETVAAPARELQDSVRQAAEKTVEETRAAYDRVKAASEEATASLEKGARTAADGLLAYNHKLVDALRANADAGFDLMKSLLGAKSLSEAIELNAAFARKQFDAVSAQGKDLAALAQKVAADSVAPVKDSLGKMFAPRG